MRRRANGDSYTGARAIQLVRQPNGEARCSMLDRPARRKANVTHGPRPRTGPSREQKCRAIRPLGLRFAGLPAYPKPEHRVPPAGVAPIAGCAAAPWSNGPVSCPAHTPDPKPGKAQEPDDSSLR